MKEAVPSDPLPALPTALDILRSARKIGFVFTGGSARCAFQVGVLEALSQLGIQPNVCVAVSGGVWNAAAVAAGTSHRLRTYWRTFSRMPRFDLSNLVREHSPFRFTEMHRRTFRRFVGAERLKRSPIPLFVGLSRLRDRTFHAVDAAVSTIPSSPSSPRTSCRRSSPTPRASRASATAMGAWSITSPTRSRSSRAATPSS